MRKLLLGLAIILGSVLNAHAATITTPNMSLVLPVPGSQLGPVWAQNLNTAFQLLDSHNHTPGSGLQIPTAGININADLQIGNYNLVNPRSLMFTNQSAALATTADKNNVYVVNGNLYFNNASGTPVQITSGSSVNIGGSGNITGMGSTTAAVTYSDITKTFTFTQSSGVTADISAGTYNLFNNTAGASEISLKAPSGLGASYNLTFPSALPVSTKLLTIDSSGNLGATYDVDNSTIQVSSGIIQIKDSGVVTSKLNNQSVTTGKIADQSVTYGKLAPRATGITVPVGGVAQSPSCGSFTTTSTSYQAVTNLSVTLTTIGRPVVILLMPDLTSTGSFMASVSGATLEGQAQVALFRDGTYIGSTFLETNNGSTRVPVNFTKVDFPGSGAHDYTIVAKQNLDGGVQVFNANLVAYEL